MVDMEDRVALLAGASRGIGTAAARAFAATGDWFADLFAMPGRIRQLVEGVERNGDARPKCASCGHGRVGNLNQVHREGWVRTLGTCESCGKVWQTTQNGNGLIAPSDSPVPAREAKPSHTPRPREARPRSDAH